MDDLNNLSRESLIKRAIWYEKKYGPYFGERGMKNWKNLFRKPTMHEWVILSMLLMICFAAWAYSHDIEACRSYIDNQTDFFNALYNQSNSQGNLEFDLNTYNWGVDNVDVEG